MPEEKRHTHREKKDKHHKHHHGKSHKRAVGALSSPMAVGEEEEREDWSANRERIERICLTPPNNTCNDCNNNGTRWASVNHGVFLCIRCSGIHRSLGVHVSKIKSTNMDEWHEAEVNLMETIGNHKGKLMYEARLPKGMKPLTGVEDEATLRAFIQQKYQEKSFAIDNINEVLRLHYKETRYGKKLRRGREKDPGHERERRSGNKGEKEEQCEETMKALYGANAESISKKSKKAKPLCGTFGVVNVPSDEYDERRRALLAHFHIVEPSVAETT